MSAEESSKSRFDATDCAVLLGCVLLSWGAWEIASWLGKMVFGALMLAAAYIDARYT